MCIRDRLLLTCKITLNGPAPCVPFFCQTCGSGYTLNSGTPHVLDPPFGGTLADPVTERDLTLGGKHKIQYADAVLYNCTPETYVILLANITPINSVQIKK